MWNKFKNWILVLITLITLVPGLFVVPVAIAQVQVGTPDSLVKYEGPEASIRDFLCAPAEGAVDPYALTNCVNRLYRFGIAAGALVLIFFLVVAGYTYIVGGEQGKAKGKAIFQNSLTGMLILLLSYVILGFINPNLTMFRPIQPPIFQAANLAECGSVGFAEKCILTGAGGVKQVVDGPNANGGSLAGKNVLMFGDSLTKGFADQLKTQVQMKSFDVKGCGGSKIEGWLNGGEGCVGGGSTKKISDYIARLSTKPDVVVIMLGTNNARGGVKADSVKAMNDVLKDYTSIWIAPPKFPQPSCYQITHENSTSADGVIASNFNGSNHSVFKSADKNIDLKLNTLINDCTSKSGLKGEGYEIHPESSGHLNWVKAFLAG